MMDVKVRGKQRRVKNAVLCLCGPQNRGFWEVVVFAIFGKIAFF